MGIVYLAREVRLDRPVAIKVLPPTVAVDTLTRERFALEARTAARLAHAHAQGIVHRDIKSDNILIERDSGRAIVADFGIAAAIGTNTEGPRHPRTNFPEGIRYRRARGYVYGRCNYLGSVGIVEGLHESERARGVVLRPLPRGCSVAAPRSVHIISLSNARRKLCGFFRPTSLLG